MARNGKDKNAIDMINGSLGNKIFLFALPLALTGILQQLFNAADVAVIGQFVGKEAMAAVGSNAPVVGLLVNLFVGVSLGTNVVIAKYTGRRDRKRIRSAVYTSLVFAVVSGLVMTGVGQLVIGPLLHMMDVPPEVYPMSLLYMRIYLCGLPIILLYNFLSAIFRSQGDTRTPLLCLTTSGIINVCLNLFFVLVVGMGVEGVAIATVIANIVSSSMLLFFLSRVKGPTSIHKRDFHVRGSVLKEILAIGIPAGVQSTVFSIANIVIQSAINGLGADYMAASSAAFNVEIFAFFILNAFGQACTTFIGQNFGAGKYDRCRRVFWIALAQDQAMTIILAAILLLFGKQFLSVFNGDPTVLELGYIRLLFILIPEPINVCIEVLSGAMRGYGRSLIPALISIGGIVGVRVIWVYTVFRQMGTYESLMAVYPASWIATAFMMTIAYCIFRKTTLVKWREAQTRRENGGAAYDPVRAAEEAAERALADRLPGRENEAVQENAAPVKSGVDHTEAVVDYDPVRAAEAAAEAALERKYPGLLSPRSDTIPPPEEGV